MALPKIKQAAASTQCLTCGVWKTLSAFYQDNLYHCQECKKEAVRSRRARMKAAYDDIQKLLKWIDENQIETGLLVDKLKAKYL